MKKKSFQNSIASILVLSFVVPVSFLIPVGEIYAQQTSGSTSQTASNSSNGALGGVTVGLLQSLPLCKDKVNGFISGIFKKGKATGPKNEYGPDGNATDRDPGPEPGSLDKKGEDAGLTDVPVSAKKVEDILEKKVLPKIESTDKKVTSIELNDTCLRSIGRLMAKLLLQKITLATVNWIKNGNEGGPFFVQDPQGFRDDILRDEILSFGQSVKNPSKFPFGQAFMQNQVRIYQNKFENNSQYSLNKLIQQTNPQYSDKDFNNDFSKGGWNAWDALTQIPGNSPMGFEMMASNELNRLVTEKTNEADKALSQSSGFLGDQRCADPKGVTKAEDRAFKNGEKGKRKCEKWEFVTPGEIIAEKARGITKYADNALLKADDLNDAIASVLDAVITRLVGSIEIDGLSDFSSEGADGSFVFDGSVSFDGDDRTQVEKDFSKFQRGTNWLKNNPEFNIRTDFTQALIDEQRTFQKKLQEQNIVLKDLNKTIYQLDYCIPGPNPKYKETTREALSLEMDKIVGKTKEDFALPDEQGIIDYFSDLPGSEFVSNTLEARKNFLLAKYYNDKVQDLTGIWLDDGGHKNPTPNTQNKQELENAFSGMLERYTNLIEKYYPESYKTSVRSEAKREFERVAGYEQIIAENEEGIGLFDSIIQRLGALKDKVDEQNTLKAEGKVTDIKYEENIAGYITEFGRLSVDMVGGEDVAEADNILQQAKDKIRYVYEDLLTGEYGCEKSIEKKLNLVTAKGVNGQDVLVNEAFARLAGFPGQDKSWTLSGQRRREYPKTVWYDYNLLKNGEVIPVPEGIKQYMTPFKPLPENKMPDGGGLKDNAKYGPGFLSPMFYDNSDYHCGSKPLEDWQLACFQISDLFTNINKGTSGRFVGRNDGNYPILTPNARKTFEDLIGIY